MGIVPWLTYEEVADRLKYDAETGSLTWIRCRRAERIGMKAESLDVSGYIQVNLGKVRGRMMVCKGHRLAWLLTHQAWPDGQIDHINGKRDDNRIVNLRVVSNTTNCENKRQALPSNKSGFLGVSPANKNQTSWEANIVVNKRQIYLGRFKTPQEAHAAYVSAKRLLHAGCTI